MFGAQLVGQGLCTARFAVGFVCSYQNRLPDWAVGGFLCCAAWVLAASLLFVCCFGVLRETLSIAVGIAQDCNVCHCPAGLALMPVCSILWLLSKAVAGFSHRVGQLLA